MHYIYVKHFDCVEFQRKVRDKLVKEANYDIDTFFTLIYEKTKNSECVKIYKERMKEKIIG
jgi:hypothetical protein